MEKTKRHIYSLLIGFVLLVVGAGIQTVSAAQLGEGITLGGYPLTSVLIGMGIIFWIIAFFFWQFTKIKKADTGAFVIGLIFIIIGLLLFADAPATTLPTTDEDCSILDGWRICGVDYAAGGPWADIDAEWDNENNPSIISVPINVGTTNNSLDQTQFRVNFSVDPIGTTGAPTDRLLRITFSTDYLMKKGGEYALVESGNEYVANWTTSEGSTGDYTVDLELTHDDVGWVYCDFKLDSGNDTWAEEMDGSVGEAFAWHIYAKDDCGHSYDWTVNVVKLTDD